MKNALIPLAYCLVFLSVAAVAADQLPGTDPRSACKADVEKLCAGVAPGDGRIAACMKRSEGQLSAACKDALAKARQRRAPGAPASPQ